MILPLKKHGEKANRISEESQAKLLSVDEIKETNKIIKNPLSTVNVCNCDDNCNSKNKPKANQKCKWNTMHGTILKSPRTFVVKRTRTLCHYMIVQEPSTSELLLFDKRRTKVQLIARCKLLRKITNFSSFLITFAIVFSYVFHPVSSSFDGGGNNDGSGGGGSLTLTRNVPTIESSLELTSQVRSARKPKFGERLLPLARNKKYNYTVTTSDFNVNNADASSNNTQNNKIFKINTLDDHQSQEHNDYYDDDFHQDTEDDIINNINLRQAKQLLRRREDNSIMLDNNEALPQSDHKEPQYKQQQHHILAAAQLANPFKVDRLMEMSTEFFVVPTSVSTSSTKSAQHGVLKTRTSYIQPSLGNDGVAPRSVLIVAPKPPVSRNLSNSANENLVTPPTIISTYPNFTGLRREPWVVPVLVLAALTMLMMGAFEVFVLFKAWRTSPSRRHLFLGQMLLLGLFACAALGAIITVQPSLISCGTIRFGVGVAYTLVFAALLVKCVFLISLNGGVYLPAPYQGLLLLFAVLIQVAIGAQWLITQPPEIHTLSVSILDSDLLPSTVASNTLTKSALATASTSTSTSASSSSTSSATIGSGGSSDATATFFHPSPELYTRVTATGTILIPLCKTQFPELLFSLIYIIFLIVFVSILAIKSRGIRDNYREATYIGLAVGGAIPIWLGWTLCGLAVAERHRDACIAFGLIATSAMVFLVMFMPKGRQLAAMGKEGLYVEDREDQFSSLSRAGSGYSPSFFHFKPIKYGVMNGGMLNSSSNTPNGNSGKHCPNNGAAPPSYTRMYHYFPAHLTSLAPPPSTPLAPQIAAHYHHPPFCFYPQASLTAQPQPPPPQAPAQLTVAPQLTQLPAMPTLKQSALRSPGLFIRPDETNLYTTLEPTLSTNPNVYFQRGATVHPGMMY